MLQLTVRREYLHAPSQFLIHTVCASPLSTQGEEFCASNTTALVCLRFLLLLVQENLTPEAKHWR